MTPEERQALREKHRQYGSYCFACGYWNEEVGDYYSASYPCDVIKVLDELDRVINAAEVYGVYAQMMADL